MNSCGLDTHNVCDTAQHRQSKAKDIMKYGILTTRRDTPVYQAIAVLVDRNVSSLPVVDNDMYLQGIISEKDVLRLLYTLRRSAGEVERFMTTEVVSFNQEDSLDDICFCLANNDFRRVAILNDDARLVSLISRSDIIRTYKERFQPSGLYKKAAKNKKPFQATEVMNKGLITVGKDDSIYHAMEALAANDITGLPVVTDNMQLIGIVSEKDIINYLCSPAPETCTVEKIMTEEVVSFSPRDSLLDICDCLIHNHFRRVTIIERGRLVGIVSRSDIIAYILRHQAAIFRRRKSDPAP
jgi:CBS domain-containing protein